MKLPHLIMGIDWSINTDKRWMTRATLQEAGFYLVFPPEPVGNIQTLLLRLRSQIPPDGSALIGFDFPIGLPREYAEITGIQTFRGALSQFGHGRWVNFYEVGANPSPDQPFYPPPTQERGKYGRQALATGIGVDSYTKLLRRCEYATDKRNEAQCLFYTLGGKQVGRGLIAGWKDVLAPVIEQIRIWPFDGDLPQLLKEPGLVIAEIYPGEAYSHIGITMGRAGANKRNRSHRQEVSAELIKAGLDTARISDAARSWIEWGFLGEDDFDATVGLLSMLKVVTGRRPHTIPDIDTIREIEGWILGQQAD